MSLDSQALATVAELQAYLQHDDSTFSDGRVNTAAMEALITRISSAIAMYLGRPGVLVAPSSAGSDTAQTVTIGHDGGAIVRLGDEGYWPIVTLTSITDRHTGEVIPARSSPGSAGWYLTGPGKRCGHAILDSYRPTAGEDSLSIVGVFGYSPVVAAAVPTTQDGRYHKAALEALRLACLAWCHVWWTSPNPGPDSVSMEGGSLSMVREQPMPERVAQLLRPYRRISL